MIPDELTWRHHVAMWSFWPVCVGSFVCAVASIPLWWFVYLSLIDSLVVPWIGVLITCLWVMFFGEYSMPIETYNRKRRGNND